MVIENRFNHVTQIFKKNNNLLNFIKFYFHHFYNS